MRICIDISQKDIKNFEKQYQKEYSKEMIELFEDVMLRIVNTYYLIRDLERIHFTQKSYPLFLSKTKLKDVNVVGHYLKQNFDFKNKISIRELENYLIIYSINKEKVKTLINKLIIEGFLYKPDIEHYKLVENKY